VIKEPTTEEELLALHNLRESDPLRYIEIASDWIRNNPDNAYAYFGRHIAWLNLNNRDRALDDINTSIELESDPISRNSRAEVYREIGDHENAIEDYENVRLTHPILWQEDWLSRLYQADSYAHLGNLTDALKCWELLPDDICTPGPNGAPPGNKAEIACELCRVAASAQGKR